MLFKGGRCSTVVTNSETFICIFVFKIKGVRFSFLEFTQLYISLVYKNLIYIYYVFVFFVWKYFFFFVHLHHQIPLRVGKGNTYCGSRGRFPPLETLARKNQARLRRFYNRYFQCWFFLGLYSSCFSIYPYLTFYFHIASFFTFFMTIEQPFVSPLDKKVFAAALWLLILNTSSSPFK